ncbi:2-oxoisovalerate dehydrogenase subunit beta [Nocardia farcinica]|nr:2-oxoisovalerate dehydrogenase subunit beta [Nocardia farcinica]
MVFLEPKKLYFAKANIELDSGAGLGRAAIRRTGTDVTVIAYGPTVATALSAASIAADDGYDLEVIDLRSIVPFDDETVMNSVRKTGRCVVVQEAPGFAGVGAEIAARIQERCFHSLHAPVLRVSGFDIPYPPPKLERHYLPTADRVLDAVDRLQWNDDPDPRWLIGATR